MAKDAPKQDAAPAKKEEKKVEKKTEEKAAEKAGAPKRPDDAHYDKLVEELTNKINEKKEGVVKINKQLDEKRKGKDAFEEEKKALWERFNQTKLMRADLISTKKSLEDAERQKERELKSVTKQAKDFNEDSIDEQIRKLEYQMSVGTMSLKEEKNMMLKIRDLKRQKPKAQEFSQKLQMLQAETAANAANSSLDPTKNQAEQLADLKSQIESLKPQMDAEWEAYKKLQEEGKNRSGGMSEIMQAKRDLQAEIEGLIKERQETKDQKRNEQKAFNEWEKAQREERNKKWAAEQERKNAEWEAERAQRELEKPNPYLDEVTLVEQTIDYCRILIGDNKKEEAAVEETTDFGDKPEGAVVLVSKKDRETNPYMAATKKKALKKKGGDKVKSTAIKHTADTFKFFDQLKMKAPVNTSEVPELLTTLNGKLEKVQEKIAAWEAERKAKLDEAAKLVAAAA